MKRAFLIAVLLTVVIIVWEKIVLPAKNGIDTSRLKPVILDKLFLIKAVYSEVRAEAIITSTYDSIHLPTSYHYLDLAIDLRLPSYYTGNKADDVRVANRLKELLGFPYDVVLEGNHIHLEYDEYKLALWKEQNNA